MKNLLLPLLITVCTIANAQYTKLLDFGGANGKYPYGSLIFDGTFLYGMTQDGGTSTNCSGGCGVIFKIKPDGTGYTDLLDFTGYNSPAYGSQPRGSLISDGTFLYGMTSGGGTGYGTIFKIKPDGTGYADLLNFSGAANGYWSDGSLISDGTFLYGMTKDGGTGTCGGNGCGVTFKIMPDGSGYSKLLDFAGIANGQNPHGSFISDGTFLYGMTYAGGTSNADGVVFKIKSDGTGFVKLLDFTGAANGANPDGSLISDGTFLYGMTENGGTNNMGVIFKIKPDGTGYTDLLNFSGTANGRVPHGSLISDGTFFYGMTYWGGANNMGVVFKIKPDGTGYVKLLDFAGIANGSYPKGDLIFDGTFLYGMTYQGGANNYGTIFKINPLGTGIAENNLKNDFNIYPNPTSGVFQIQSNSHQLSIINQIEICNVLGEKIFSQKNQNEKSEIDLTKQPNGIYFLQLKTEQGTAVKKIIINH